MQPDTCSHCDGSLYTLVQALRIRKIIDRQTLVSLLKFRFTTETEAAAEAAHHVTANDIAYLTNNLKIKEEHLTDISVITESYRPLNTSPELYVAFQALL